MCYPLFFSWFILALFGSSFFFIQFDCRSWFRFLSLSLSLLRNVALCVCVCVCVSSIRFCWVCAKDAPWNHTISYGGSHRDDDDVYKIPQSIWIDMEATETTSVASFITPLSHHHHPPPPQKKRTKFLFRVTIYLYCNTHHFVTRQTFCLSIDYSNSPTQNKIHCFETRSFLMSKLF